MSLSGYIIEKYNCMSNAYTCNRLVEEAANLGIDLRIIGIHDSYCTSDGIYNGNEKLEPRDFLINRYKWGNLKDQLNTLVTRTYNEVQHYNTFVNKYEQVRLLKSDAFIMPKYILGTTSLDYANLENILGTPIVAKGLESSMGQEIFLIENEGEYQKFRESQSPQKEWLYEEFISTSFGRDMRFYSIRGKVIAAMERKSKGDFRANVALGASVKPLNITPAMVQIARDIYEQTGLDFLGIDLLYGEDKSYFCEINVMPGIEGIESATGVNVAREIVKTIKGDF
ncbi:MAG: ATP-grasp domain-containing protein [Lachnospiraceae bacterium]|nr:ATP-grasp domain-containing protein [Lachnospiraceae bacterium]